MSYKMSITTECRFNHRTQIFNTRKVLPSSMFPAVYVSSGQSIFFGWLVPTSARGGLSCSRSLLETKSQVKGVEIEAFIHRLASTNGEETPASAVSPETHGGMHTGRGHSYDSCLDKRRSGQ